MVNIKMTTLKELNQEVIKIEQEWIKKIEEVNEEYAEKRLFVFERIAELKGEPIF